MITSRSIAHESGMYTTAILSVRLSVRPSYITGRIFRELRNLIFPIFALPGEHKKYPYDFCWYFSNAYILLHKILSNC